MKKKVIFAVLGGAAAIGCTVASVILIRKCTHDLVEGDTVIENSAPGDTDGDTVEKDRYIRVDELDERPEDKPVRIVPDINNGASLSDIAAKYMKADGDSVMHVIAKDEYEDIPYEDRHEAVYFVLDDILAGFDSEMEELESDGELFLVGVNALMASGKPSVYLKDTVTGIGYEIFRSEENYLEVYKEINGVFDHNMMEDSGEADEEDADE